MQIKYKFVTAIKKAAERTAFLVIFTETAVSLRTKHRYHAPQ